MLSDNFVVRIIWWNRKVPDSNQAAGSNLLDFAFVAEDETNLATVDLGRTIWRVVHLESDLGAGRSERGNAIRVNRYRYCLSDFAVIVETRRTGGVWLGADENRKENWVPAFVRAEGTVPRGNEALLSLGLMSLTEKEVSECDSIGEYLISRLTLRYDPSHSGGPVTTSLSDADGKLFDIFCEQLASFAVTVARSPEEIQDHFEIEPEQTEVWIARALAEGLLEEIGDADQYQARQQNKPK